MMTTKEARREVAPPDVIEKVADAIERARCPGREGPYGLYDYTSYGHPKPHHVRDFRDPCSDTWGHAVLMTTDRAEAQSTYERLTREHVALAAIAACVSDGNTSCEDRESGLSGEAMPARSASADTPILPPVSTGEMGELIERLQKASDPRMNMANNSLHAEAAQALHSLQQKLKEAEAERDRWREEAEGEQQNAAVFCGRAKRAESTVEQMAKALEKIARRAKYDEPDVRDDLRRDLRHIEEIARSALLSKGSEQSTGQEKGESNAS